MSLTQDKVRGMFLGIAIGDAMGKPVETFSAEKIRDTYGRVTSYLPNTGHKWFDGELPGTWTDDTQLTLAVARSFLETHRKYGQCRLDLQEVAIQHVEEFNKCTKGWGRSTRASVKNLSDGVGYRQSGFAENGSPAGSGFGNGVAMKISPLSVYLSASEKYPVDISDDIALFAGMTHPTSMGVASAFAQCWAVQYCLDAEPENFNQETFIRCLEVSNMLGETYYSLKHLDEIIDPSKSVLGEKFSLLKKYPEYDTECIINEFKGGCYIPESLPFTYMFFLKNPQSIESLYDVISAGGDTDTNGSMLACLLGSLHGTSIFPEDLVKKLDQKDMILDISDRLSSVLGILS